MFAGLSILLAQEQSFFAEWGPLWIIGGAAVILFALVMLIVLFLFFPIWFQAYMSSANVSMLSLVGMSLRQVNSRVIVRGKVMAMQAGLGRERDTGITTRRLEAHFLAGGSVPKVISALIAAHRADIPLTFDQAAAIDLAGRDVLEAVQTSVNPKVIDCPDPSKSGQTTLSAIAKNGVELKVRARVTVRTNLDGKKGLDAQTAFEIVSIDIADIDVGQNIGARLQADQAEADTRVARAKAEQRRALAMAREQEMKAEVARNRARVVLAEAEIPLAMAAAFREGNLEGPGRN